MNSLGVCFCSFITPAWPKSRHERHQFILLLSQTWDPHLILPLRPSLEQQHLDIFTGAKSLDQLCPSALQPWDNGLLLLISGWSHGRAGMKRDWGNGFLEIVTAYKTLEKIVHRDLIPTFVFPGAEQADSKTL